jgi:hypothetical protein
MIRTPEPMGRKLSGGIRIIMEKKQYVTIKFRHYDTQLTSGKDV